MDRHDWATDLEKNSISGKASSRPPGAQKKASMPLREYPMTHMVEPYAEVDLEALPNIGDEGQHKVDASERIVAEDNDKELGKRRRRELRSIPLSKMEFYDRLTASGIRHLYGRAGTPQEPKSYKIELSTLQRMVIHDTQRKLVLLVRQIVRQHRVNSITLKRAQTLLSQYSETSYYSPSYLPILALANKQTNAL
jgi:hypothetical protein